MDDKPFEGKEPAKRAGKAPAVFLAIVGALWLSAMGWVLALLIELTRPRPKVPILILLVIGLLMGPFCMMSGSILTFGRKLGKTARVMLIVGCAILSGVFLVLAVDGARRMGTPQAPPSYWPYAALGCLVILTDLSAWQLLRATILSTADVPSSVKAKSADSVL
jgi:hypothetical protein